MRGVAGDSEITIVPVEDELPGPVTVGAREPAIIGRARDCRILLGAEPVSKHHAEIRWTGDAWCLTDLDSHNGTLLNGWKVAPRVPVILHNGDVLAVGPCRLQVRVGPAPAPPKPATGTYATNPSIFRRLRDSNTIDRELGWEDFRRRYAPVIVGYSRNAGLPAQDAEDVLQDVMLGFFRVAPHFEYEPQRGRFRGYLKRATLNAIRKRVKRAGAARTVPDELLDDRVEPAETRWEEHWAGQILARALDEARRRFDARTVEAFDLYCRRGVPVEEVARRLGLSRDSVYQAKSRVLKVAQAVVEQLRADEG